MQLLLLAILITLLGWWSPVGFILLIIAGLYAVGWILYGIYRLIIWIILNWNKNVLVDNDTIKAEIPIWFNGDMQQWIEFRDWCASIFQVPGDTSNTRVPSWFNGNRKKWNEFQRWNSNRLEEMRTELDSDKPLINAVMEKIPAWFGGDEQQWTEFLIWHKNFFTEAEHNFLKSI